MSNNLNQEIEQAFQQVRLVLRDKFDSIPVGELQIFLRACNRLLEVNSLVSEIESQGSEYQGLLSIKIVDANFSRRTLKYLLNRGIRYIGEIYRIFINGSPVKSWENYKNGVYEVLEGLGLPRRLNVVEFWLPPYWANPEFINLLNMPIDELLKRGRKYIYLFGENLAFELPEGQSYKLLYEKGLINLTRSLHLHGIHYFGDLLRLLLENFSMFKIINLQRIMLDSPNLHAAAILPDGWVSPENPPQIWLDDYQALLEEIQNS